MLRYERITSITLAGRERGILTFDQRLHPCLPLAPLNAQVWLIILRGRMPLSICRDGQELTVGQQGCIQTQDVTQSIAGKTNQTTHRPASSSCKLLHMHIFKMSDWTQKHASCAEHANLAESALQHAAGLAC